MRESLGWSEGLYFLFLLFLVDIIKWTCKLYAGVVKPFLSDLLREPVIVYEGSKRSGVINYLILEVPYP